MNRLLVFLTLFIVVLQSCKKDEIDIIPEPVPLEQVISPGVALKWSKLTIDVIKNSPDNSPTYASRALGYIGLTMYESVVNGSIIFKSISTDLNGLGKITKPDSIQNMDWELALNAGQQEILKSLYAHAPEELIQKIDSLYQSTIDKKMGDAVSEKVFKTSDLYGKLVARQLFEWSKIDNGHEGYKTTFDSSYPYPRGATNWLPPAVGQSSVMAPMHPYWGKNRTFSAGNSMMEIPEFIQSTLDTASAYFKEMRQVYDIKANLSQEEKEMALWWGDDPSVSAGPPGHSYYLNILLVEKNNTNLFESASSFAKVGMSVADAFINVFKCKYYYHSERPRNYIVRNIDRLWVQFWPEPPFPGFTCGHSTQAAAASTAMISVFGDENIIIDQFHNGRPKDLVRNIEFKTREFNNIWKIAEECGWSRILGGIHTPQDNNVGLAEGKKIGENINALGWKYE